MHRNPISLGGEIIQSINYYTVSMMLGGEGGAPRCPLLCVEPYTVSKFSRRGHGDMCPLVRASFSGNHPSLFNVESWEWLRDEASLILFLRELTEIK